MWYNYAKLKNIRNLPSEAHIFRFFWNVFQQK